MPRFAVVTAGLAILAVVMVGIARVTGKADAGPVARPLGSEALVGHIDRSGGDPGVRTRIGLTVLDVRRGTQGELAANGLEVDEEDRDATPYYVDARFVNKGGNAVQRDLDVGLEDADGNLLHPLVIFSFGESTPFAPCRAVTEGTLAPGESYAPSAQMGELDQAAREPAPCPDEPAPCNAFAVASGRAAEQVA